MQAGEGEASSALSEPRRESVRISCCPFRGSRESGPGSSSSSATTHSVSPLVPRGLQLDVEKRSHEGGCGVQMGKVGELCSWRPTPHAGLGVPRALQGMRVCAGGCRDTHQGVLALPPRPPHLPCSCAGLLPLLLATCLLLLLSLLRAQTQPVKPGLDPTGLLPDPPPQQPHSQGCAVNFTLFLPGKARATFRAPFKYALRGGTSGGADPLCPSEGGSPSRWPQF